MLNISVKIVIFWSNFGQDLKDIGQNFEDFGQKIKSYAQNLETFGEVLLFLRFPWEFRKFPWESLGGNSLIYRFEFFKNYLIFVQKRDFPVCTSNIALTE